MLGRRHRLLQDGQVRRCTLFVLLSGIQSLAAGLDVPEYLIGERLPRGISCVQLLASHHQELGDGTAKLADLTASQCAIDQALHLFHVGI